MRHIENRLPWIVVGLVSGWLLVAGGCESTGTIDLDDDDDVADDDDDDTVADDDDSVDDDDTVDPDADGDGWTVGDGDCNDEDPVINPGAEELCDGIDNDCNPDTDENVDNDGDGVSACEGDCADADPTIFPGAQEMCDGVDQDCDGSADEPCTTDSILQEGNDEVDVIWVVDNSCSMAEEQEALGDFFPVYYTALNTTGMDYRIAVVTTDNADFQGDTPVIDPLTPDGEDVFAENVSVGTGGSGTERGLRFGYDAAEMAADGTAPNTGFWREQAGLRVIFVSDEPDQSGSWSDYVAQYQALKPNPAHVILSALTGTDGVQATSCSGPYGSASGGSGYVEAVAATGGTLGSICDADWSAFMTSLGAVESVHVNDTFPLGQPAVPETVIVVVDGVEALSGWTFNEPLNAVIFDPGTVPPNGALVEITYAVVGQ